MRGRSWVLLVVAAAVIFALGLYDNVGRTGGGNDQASTSTTLPREAMQTIVLIDNGGPFPYASDGFVFMNRERHLPQHPNGYWHEYSVPTPGESDRGARRIIHGDGGEFYYTGDHHASFQHVPTQ